MKYNTDKYNKAVKAFAKQIAAMIIEDADEYEQGVIMSYKYVDDSTDDVQKMVLKYLKKELK